MLINSWIKTTVDDEVDDPDEDGDSWYYFGSKGKKVTSDSKKSTAEPITLTEKAVWKMAGMSLKTVTFTT